MKLVLTRAMVDALDVAVDRPDWLIAEVERLKRQGEPYEMSLDTQQGTALEELCTMNIRFEADDSVKPEHRPLDELSLLILKNY